MSSAFTTVRAKSISTPLGDLASGNGRRSRSQTVSEQRRALLLPQEVKELGAEEAIIFYEGLRPIRCRKIRYFQDRRFKARLKPPPEHAAPPTGKAAESLMVATPHAADAKEAVPEAADSSLRDLAARSTAREATVADIDRLDTLRLEDFAVDFNRVHLQQKPAGERLTSEELQAAVDSFLETLRST